MDDEDKRLRRVTALIQNSAAGSQTMNIHEAQQSAKDLRDLITSGELSLDDRDAAIGAMVIFDARVAELSGTNGAFDQSDREYQNKQIIEGFLEKGDMKSALLVSKSLDASGEKVVGVHIDKTKVQPYLDGIQKARDERVPILMDQLNIDEQAANEWFETYESHAYGEPPSLLGAAPAPKPEPVAAKGSLPSDEHLVQWSSKP